MTRWKVAAYSVFLLLSLSVGPLLAQLVPSFEPETQEVVVEVPPKQRYLNVLKYQDIEPTAEGARNYLERLLPDHPDRIAQDREAKLRIEDLASPEYRVRRRALNWLGKIKVPPTHLFLAARESSNPEVAAAASELLRRSKLRKSIDSTEGATEAICEMVVYEKMKGVALPLLSVVPLMDEGSIQSDLRAAIKISAIDSDMEQLNQAMVAGGRNVRLSALSAVVALQGKESEGLLRGLLQDADEQVRLLAANEAANLGIRNSIDSLLGLMNSEDSIVRAKSHRFLRAFTGQNFKYYAYDDKQGRSKAMQAWSEWLAKNKETAELKYPLDFSRVMLGRILVADYSARRVVELDMNGKLTWETEVESPWAVKGLPNGHRLVGTYSPGRIIEFDGDGKEVWRLDDLNGSVMGIARLENGNTVAARSDSDLVEEYDRKGKVVWKMKLTGRPTDVQVLENGNLLVALMNKKKVVEVNRDKEIVWELATIPNPLHISMTSEGTIFVSGNTGSTAAEYNRDGTECKNSVIADSASTSVYRTAEGMTLRNTEKSIEAYDASGKRLWTFEGLTYSFGMFPY